MKLIDPPTEIVAELPYPPSLNRYYRSVGGKVLISAAGRQYRRAVQMALFGLVRQPLTGRLSVTILVSPPDKRKRDLDNTQKSLLDSMQHAGVYADDSQIDHLYIRRCPVVAGGAVKVFVQEV